MKIVNIPKGNGKFRTIYVPNKQEKAHLRSLVWKIADRAEKACPKEVPHGFMRKRSPVTNAQAHVGHEFTLTMDLRDFFATYHPHFPVLLFLYLDLLQALQFFS